MVTKKEDHWGLAQWAALATILGLIVAIIGVFFAARDKGASTASAPPSPPSSADTNQSVVPTVLNPAGSDANTAKTSSVVRFLSSQSSTSDPEEIPYYNGSAWSSGPQEVNGQQFVRNVNFPRICADTSPKFADYNLGRHFKFLPPP
jgi:hypothetical protein